MTDDFKGFMGTIVAAFVGLLGAILFVPTLGHSMWPFDYLRRKWGKYIEPFGNYE